MLEYFFWNKLIYYQWQSTFLHLKYVKYLDKNATECHISVIQREFILQLVFKFKCVLILAIEAYFQN